MTDPYGYNNRHQIATEQLDKTITNLLERLQRLQKALNNDDLSRVDRYGRLASRYATRLIQDFVVWQVTEE